MLQGSGNSVSGMFLWPGDLVLSRLIELAPVLAAELGIAGSEASFVLRVAVSMVLWLFATLVAIRVVRLGRDAARTVAAIVRAMVYRASQSLRNQKTRLVCFLRRLVPRRRSADDSGLPGVEFDDLDLAVLQTAAALGTGFAISAPELAERFTMRPAQVQRSLDKLSSNRMLDYVIGSTDGFDNYRLSVPGAAFIASWQRNSPTP